MYVSVSHNGCLSGKETPIFSIGHDITIYFMEAGSVYAIVGGEGFIFKPHLALIDFLNVKKVK